MMTLRTLFQKKIGVGQEQSERQNAEYGNPDDVFRPILSPTGPPMMVRRARQENEKVELSALQGRVKFPHQIKRVIAHQLAR